MTTQPFVVGAWIRDDEPRWEPLERAVGADLVDTFMWMFEVQTTDRHRFQAYKHISTRRYLHVDHQGGAYLYLGEVHSEDRYRRVPLADAIELALRPWWEELDATADEVADAHAAIERARRSEEADAA
jgi:hypothetical protein